jgi:hypothetical protein
MQNTRAYTRVPEPSLISVHVQLQRKFNITWDNIKLKGAGCGKKFQSCEVFALT